MGEHTSRVGQRADKFTVNDDPHDRYFDSGVPILLNAKNGKIVRKSVTHETLWCRQCERVGYYDENAEPLCEACGRILHDTLPRTNDGQALLSDAKAAGRL